MCLDCWFIRTLCMCALTAQWITKLFLCVMCVFQLIARLKREIQSLKEELAMLTGEQRDDQLSVEEIQKYVLYFLSSSPVNLLFLSFSSFRMAMQNLCFTIDHMMCTLHYVCVSLYYVVTSVSKYLLGSADVYAMLA